MRLWVVLILVACSSDPPTKGDHCERIFRAFCERGQACGALTVSVEACVSETVAACCEDGHCPDDSPASDGDVDRCVDDMRVFPCEVLDDPQLPASCLVL